MTLVFEKAGPVDVTIPVGAHQSDFRLE